ncbi:MAG TPA: CinA family protein [Acholeplasmataceae bacterium]|nr:CinA family protein [Acholeplasmataceae bacterium]
MKAIVKHLIDKDLKIAVAESMTGGNISASITKHANASKVFKGAIIAYTKEVKVSVLKIDENLIDKHSSVSLEVLEAMNNGLKELIDANIYISTTGNAGPSFELNSNELMCYILVDYEGSKHYRVVKFESSKRFKNIKRATNEVVSILREII